jgi:hypothetical protein
LQTFWWTPLLYESRCFQHESMSLLHESMSLLHACAEMEIPSTLVGLGLRALSLLEETGRPNEVLLYQ